MVARSGRVLLYSESGDPEFEFPPPLLLDRFVFVGIDLPPSYQLGFLTSNLPNRTIFNCVVKPKSKESLWQFKEDTGNPVNQSQLGVNTCS